MHSEFYFGVFDFTLDRVPSRFTSSLDVQLPFPIILTARYCFGRHSGRKERTPWMQPLLYSAPVKAHLEDVRRVGCSPAVLASYRTYRAGCRSSNPASLRQRGKDWMNSSNDLPVPSCA